MVVGSSRTDPAEERDHRNPNNQFRLVDGSPFILRYLMKDLHDKKDSAESTDVSFASPSK